MNKRLGFFCAIACALLTPPTAFATPSADFRSSGYYQARPDLRRCVSPLCGGWFVQRVNRKFTRCADGSYQRECYVATVRNAPAADIGFGQHLLVRGKIRSREFEGFGNLGEFVLRAAWVAASDTPAEGRFVGLENNGIVCITTPCFSFDQHLLNRGFSRELSGIELGETGAAPELVDEAMQLLADGEVLLATGVNHQTQEMAGIGRLFVATQFYLPLR